MKNSNQMTPSTESLVQTLFQSIHKHDDSKISKAEMMTRLLCASALESNHQEMTITKIRENTDSFFLNENGPPKEHVTRQDLLQFFRQMHSKNGEEATVSQIKKYIQGAEYHLYFGYGSNMSLEGMVTKKLQPVRFIRAKLHHWKLIFDMHVLNSRCDPSFANVVPQPQGQVHGVAIVLSTNDLQAMDRIEISYKRLNLPIELYEADGGGSCIAQVYVFTQEIAEERNIAYFVQQKEINPSQRYLNMMLNGARQKQLNEAYIKSLSNHPVTKLPSLDNGLTKEILDVIHSRQFTLSEIAATKGQNPALYVLKGVVFKAFGPYASILGGRDTTLFEAQRVKMIRCIDDISREQKEWVNARLAEGIAKQGSADHQIVGMTNFNEYDW